jgi:ferredoxin
MKELMIPVISFRDCVGCEACVELCPDIFEMRDDKALVKGNEHFIPDQCRGLLTMCPTGAISLEHA